MSKLFDMIAPIYAKFYNFQLKYYGNIVDNQKALNLENYKNILDLGCGTGALCNVFYDRGLKITGVDVSKGMLETAKKNLENKDIDLIEINAGQRLPFKDNSFDIVISSYVAHGIKGLARIDFYKEAARVAKHKLIIHDYHGKMAPHTVVIELLENGDYFNFIKIAEDELRDLFGNLSIEKVDKRAAWYIIDIDKVKNNLNNL